MIRRGDRDMRRQRFERTVGPEGDALGSSALVLNLAPPQEAPDEAMARLEGRESGSSKAQGLLVEFVRLIIVALGAASGWEVALATGAERTGPLLLGIILGSGIGYVVGGVFGRTTVSAVSQLERQFTRIPAADVLAGGTGLLLGIIVATLVSVPLFHLPSVAAYPTVAFSYLLCSSVGYKVGRVKSEDLFALFGVKPWPADHRPGQVTVVDSSAILDGRIMGLVRMGFVNGTLLITRGVLEEIQAVADSSNPGRRSRGRKALDVLLAMKRHSSVDVVLVRDDAGPAGESTDSQLVRLAKGRGGVLMTNDSALAKIAGALDVPVRSIYGLADALRPPVFAGENVPLRLTRQGRESGQGIGYLDDGTMVIVEDADRLIGETVEVSVTNVIQTPTGQLVFGRLATDASR